MQIEIKMVLDGTKDYQVLVDHLSPLYLDEETYCDFFFDFDMFALTNDSSVLRLRVPCEKPLSVPPANSAPSQDTNGNDNMSAAFQDFLSSCDAAQQPTGANGAEVRLIPNATGKLVFKQKNTVERGHQFNFVVECKNVPSEVVQELLSPDGASPYVVLSNYASQLDHSGRGELNKVTQILEKIRHVASQYCETPTEPSATSGDAMYSQIRYAAGMTSQAEANPMETDKVCQNLKNVGNYVTTRKIFQYFKSSKMRKTLADQSVLDALRIRVDRTLFPSGDIYEVEIPRCDIPADEVLEELTETLNNLQVSFHFGSEGKYSRYVKELRSQKAQTEEITDVKLCLTNVYGYEAVKKNFESIVEGQRASLENDRKISNIDYNLAECVTSGELFQEELQENYFFDGPNDELRSNGCFLRLRRLNHQPRYNLVLKENQTVVEGQQGNQTIKMELSETDAALLLKDPTSFLTSQQEHNSIARTLYYNFSLRSLRQTAFFTNYRISVPWWASSSQRTTAHQKNPLGTQQFDVSPSYLLSQQQQHQDFVPPLTIHLDRTQYEVQPRPSERIPFSQPPPSYRTPISTDADTGRRVYELYEMEVTNIVPTTNPTEVLNELANVLVGLGVEFTKASHSKLEQYFILADC
ncbi:CYTH domain containing protein, putative [Angomonas deanei]|uniref:CYTH domain containing protein, putative n=1 Tax=Angomonas deanei TaxID=59799 RepID=A0A7G2CFR7_9TRYP|nr:CYTH domain containing protein, putative [Angomonas deanei]